MRLLNKFYSFTKSIYLNNSKFSNNLRHTLRLFFEREIKTKHTPALFGSTFKGSKWVDYKTFNINKLLIKSGMSYFMYIFTTVSLVFLLMGRSKSEQYFGFFPLFSYINFVLGYIPLVLGDLVSQVIVLSYVFYNLFILLIRNFFNKLFTNTLYVLGNSYQKTKHTVRDPNSSTSVQLTSLFRSDNTDSINALSTGWGSLFGLTKTLNLVTKDVFTINFTTTNKHLETKLYTPNYNFYLNTLHSKFNPNTYNPTSTFTSSESFYKNSLTSLLDTKIINTRTNLNDIFKIYKTINNSNLLYFSIENNLNMSKQQRWLVKNSLLSELLAQNSFLFTQSKKLIGLSSLDKNFTSKNLWLPTKLSKLSSLESTNYVNSFLKNFFNNHSSVFFTKQNHINNSNFNNLNFFENSRLWLFKKYYFSINQNLNLITEVPKVVELHRVNNPSIPSRSHKNTYYYNLHLLNTKHLLVNTLTPSLHRTLLNKKLINDTLNTSNVANKINTPQLDVITSSNINLFYTITSNIQDSTSSYNNTNYFSNAQFLQKNIIVPKKHNSTLRETINFTRT